METRVATEFSEESEIERQALRETLLSALETNTLTAIRAAQERLKDWLHEHPDDYIMRDAGEPLALTEDALLTLEREQYPVEAL